MTVYTGIVGKITVSGTVISGQGVGDAAGAIEGTVVIGRELGKFNVVGTDIPEITDGMKDVSGTLRRKWISAQTLFQNLLDNKNEFTVLLEISGTGAKITASGCRCGQITRRAAPGTEVLVEEMPFIGRDWSTA